MRHGYVDNDDLMTKVVHESLCVKILLRAIILFAYAFICVLSCCVGCDRIEMFVECVCVYVIAHVH